MIKGLDIFAAHFRNHTDRYTLIGGVATWLLLDEAGLDPRATKDLDIVLCIEALDAEFAEEFWQFIEAGDYSNRQKSTGDRIFYRFHSPADTRYPVMLELFSRQPDGIALDDGQHLVPVPVEEDISSLSAILLDDDYYSFLFAHARELGGVSIVTEAALVPLKACAWLDLTERKKAGENIDSKTIRKHRSDVLRLSQLLQPDATTLPAAVAKDMERFLAAVEPELDTQMLRNLDIRGIGVPEVMQSIRHAYGLES